jgi:hypothetical protein
MLERPTGRFDNPDRVGLVLPTFELQQQLDRNVNHATDRIIGTVGDALCRPDDRLPQRSSISPNPAITSWAPMIVAATWAIDNRFCVACERISS